MKKPKKRRRMAKMKSEISIRNETWRKSYQWRYLEAMMKRSENEEIRNGLKMPKEIVVAKYRRRWRSEKPKISLKMSA
jgi:hypothetical protein